MKYRISRRDFLRTALVTASGAVLASCAGGSPQVATETEAPTEESQAAPEAEEPESSAPPAAEPGTIAMWGWWDIRMAIYDEAAQGFMQENPGVKIKVEDVAEILQKVNAAVAAGTGPTLLKQDSEYYFNMRSQDLLVPYPEDLFPDSWFEETFPNYDYKGYGRYVVPTGSTPYVLIYNKAHFQEAGLDPENPPKTWDELIEAGKQLVQVDSSGSITRNGFIHDLYFGELPLIFQAGGDILKEEGGKRVATLNSEPVQQAFQFHTSLATDHKIWDPAVLLNYESFGTGNAAMTSSYTWIIGEFKANYPDVYQTMGMASPPTPTGEANPVTGYKSPVLDFSVMKGHPEQYDTAFKFLKYMYDQRQDVIFKLVDLMALAPENIHVIEDPKVKGDPILQKMAEITGTQHDPLQTSLDLDRVLKDARDQIILNGVSVADALQMGNDELQSLIDSGLFDSYNPLV
jgi:multiple sugar transport system substrate-binding protein